MPTTARELAGWSDQRWQAVQEAVEKALATTAKCRQVVPKGSDQIGDKAVVIPVIAAGPPMAYGADIIATPVQIFSDVTLDDQHAQREEEIIRLMETAAAQLGVLEDQEIVQGAPPAPLAGAMAAAAPVAAPRSGRVPRNPGLRRLAARAAPGGGPVAIGAAVVGGNPTGAELYTAITTAVASLEGAGRPGRFGLLVHNTLMATLRQPRVPGGVPLIQEVEGLIGSSEIVGTSALDGAPFAAGSFAAILFRLEPASMDIVHTLAPTVTVLGRAAGSTELRVEEEIVLRILDPLAVQPIVY